MNPSVLKMIEVEAYKDAGKHHRRHDTTVFFFFLLLFFVFVGEGGVWSTWIHQTMSCVYLMCLPQSRKDPQQAKHEFA